MRASTGGLLLALSAVGVGLGPARAADLPSRLQPPVYIAPPAAYSWTGLYIGVNAGFAYDHVPTPYEFYTPDRAPIIGMSSHGLVERGPLVGGQVGYNSELVDVPYLGAMVQHAPMVSGSPTFSNIVSHIVVGVEADLDWADINGHINLQTPIGPTLLGTHIRNFGTLRARAGYTYDRFFGYLFTGFSFATTENYFSSDGFAGTETAARLPARLATYGIGLEYAINDKWSIKVEEMYDYIRAYSKKFEPVSNVSINYLSRTTFNSARVGLNYKLDVFGPPSVVARY